MKKFLTVLMVVSLLAMLCLSVSAKEIRFNVNDDSETPYLHDSSSIGADQTYSGFDDGGDPSAVYFMDGTNYVTYKFVFDANDVSAFISVITANEYQVGASKNDIDYTTLGEEPEHIHSRENFDRRNFDLTSFLQDNPTKTVYVTFTDSYDDEGWGTYITAQIAVYSSDKEFTVNKVAMEDITLRNAPANLAELVTFKEVAAVAPVEAAPEATEVTAAPAAEAAPAPAPVVVSVPQTGDGFAIYAIAALLALSAIMVVAKRQKSK